MRRYELMLLFRPDPRGRQAPGGSVREGDACHRQRWRSTRSRRGARRRLAYDIKHFREASYFLIHFDIAPTEVRGIERGILITEEILRHLVTVLEEKALGRADDDMLDADEATPAPLGEADDILPEELPDEVGEEDEVAAQA